MVRPAVAMNEWESLEGHRFQLVVLAAILLGPTLSALPIVTFDLVGRSALVAAALVVCLTGAVTYGLLTHRILAGYRAVQWQLQDCVGDGPSLGELISRFPAFVGIQDGFYVVAIGEWDAEQGDRRTHENADRLAEEARRTVSSYFMRPIPVRWCWEEASHGYPTWDRSPRSA